VIAQIQISLLHKSFLFGRSRAPEQEQRDENGDSENSDSGKFPMI